MNTLRRFKLALRYWHRLRYSWHLAWVKADRRHSKGWCL